MFSYIHNNHLKVLNMSAKTWLTQKLLCSISHSSKKRWCQGETWWVVFNPPMIPLGWQKTDNKRALKYLAYVPVLPTFNPTLCRMQPVWWSSPLFHEPPSLVCALAAFSIWAISSSLEEEFYLPKYAGNEFAKGAELQWQKSRGRASLFHFSSQLVD